MTDSTVSEDPGAPDEDGRISEDAFFDHWGVIRRPDGDFFSFEDVRDKDPTHVWTLCDDGEGGLVYSAGFHLVNRIDYVMTERPWVTGLEYVPIPCEPGDDDEDEEEAEACGGSA